MEKSKDCLQPFFMVIEKVGAGKFTPRVIVSGTVKSGELRAGDKLDLLGMGEEDLPLYCQGVSVGGYLVQSVKAGDDIRVILQIDRDRFGSGYCILNPSVGQVLATPNSTQCSWRLMCRYCFFTKAEGGKGGVFADRSRFVFGINHRELYGQISLPQEMNQISAGEEVEAIIDLVCPIAVMKDDEFSIIHKGETVGRGKVVKMVRLS